MLKIIGLIPARKDSKRIPNKNMKICAGKPLIKYTIDAVLKSSLFNSTYISTDSLKIAEYSNKKGIKIPFLRPKKIANDKTEMIEVVKHFVNWADKNIDYDAILLLQPTSPMRTSNHIDKAIQLYKKRKPDTLVSVCKPTKEFSISRLYISKNDTLINLNQLVKNNKNKIFMRNGPAILIIDKKIIRKNKLYGKKVIPFHMNNTDSIDIDTTEDFKLAQKLILKK